MIMISEKKLAMGLTGDKFTELYGEAKERQERQEKIYGMCVD